MAESPPRSDMPESVSGGDRNAPQTVEDADAPEQPAAPTPWGGARPWWSADPGDGTGPHAMPAPANRSGAHPRVGGTGPHGVLRDGTGPHGALADGSGAHPVIPGGTGPLPPVPHGPPLPKAPAPRAKGRFRRFLMLVGGTAVAAVVLGAGVLAFRMDDGSGGGTEKDARTAGVPVSKKVIKAVPNAGGLHKDPLTPPQASAAYPFVAGAVRAGGVPVAEQGRAVYGGQPARPLNVLFMGGTGPVGDPESFLQKIRPTTFIAGQDADPGEKGGKAVCGTFAVLADTHTYCAWATPDSYGVVASNRATLNPRFPLMAEVMRRIRNDVEKPR